MMMYDMPAGAFVFEVGEGSAAEEAGIEKGNIITALDGMEIGSSDALVEQIRYYGIGETVKVELMVSEGSSYTKKEVEVTLQGPAEDQKDDKASDKEDKEPEDLQDEEPKADEEPKPDEEPEEIPEEEGNFFDFFGGGDNFEQFFGHDGRF